MGDMVLMQKGMKCLGDALGIVEAERFIVNLKTEAPFDYTEWRQENLYEGMTLDELAESAAEHCRDRQTIERITKRGIPG
jgi:plasmid replication initiation protein